MGPANFRLLLSDSSYRKHIRQQASCPRASLEHWALVIRQYER